MSLLHHENCDLQEVFLSKLPPFSQRNNVLDAPASNTYGCLGEPHVFLQLS
jgi:hypothetical protein